MRIVSYLALLLLVFISCQESESQNDLDMLTEENLRLKDSIDKMIWQKEKSFLQKEVKMDFSKGLLGHLYYADTLILSAQFADCGEFGGHKEYLKIYSYKKKYNCLYLNKKIDCDKSYTDFVQVDSTLFELSKVDQEHILNYMNDLMRISMLHQDWIDHQSNDYELILSSSLSGEPYFLESNQMYWYFQDASLEWPGFTELRDSIIQ